MKYKGRQVLNPHTSKNYQQESEHLAQFLTHVLSGEKSLKDSQNFSLFQHVLKTDTGPHGSMIMLVLEATKNKKEHEVLQRLAKSVTTESFSISNWFRIYLRDEGKLELSHKLLDHMAFHIMEQCLWNKWDVFYSTLAGSERSAITVLHAQLRYLEGQKISSKKAFAERIILDLVALARINKMSEEVFLLSLIEHTKDQFIKRSLMLYRILMKERLRNQDAVELAIIFAENNRVLSALKERFTKVKKLHKVVETKATIPYEANEVLKFGLDSFQAKSKGPYQICSEESALIKRLPLLGKFNTLDKELTNAYMFMEFYSLVRVYLSKFKLNKEFLFVLLEATLHSGELDEFIHEYDKNVKIHQDDKDFRYLLGLAYKKANKNQEAQKCFSLISKEDDHYRSIQEFLRKNA